MNRGINYDQKVVCIKDLQEYATVQLPLTTKEFFNEGAMDLITLNDNISAFDRYKLRPRLLKDVSNVDSSTSCFGKKVTFPLGFSPTAMHGLAHQDAEIASSRAASNFGINMILSTYSNTSIEDVINQSNGSNSYCQQLSIVKDNSINMSIINRAEKAGYQAIFLTIDCPYLGRRLNEYKNNFSLPKHLKFPNLPYNDEEGDMTNGVTSLEYDNRLDWEDIKRFKEKTKCEIWLKGILTAEDALLAVESGVDGILVSNHGGRQLDHVMSTLDALPEIVEAVNGRIPIHLDGGIRRGSDIFKALALGASHVWIGRTVLWGLSYKGQEGVELAVKLLHEEFKLTMALTGCSKVEDITPKHLARLHADGRYYPL